MPPPAAVLFDLDRTLVDVQSTTDYAAALRDVEELVGAWDDPPMPPTGWDGPTRRAMGVLVALAGDPRWQQVSDLVERHELAAVPHATAMFGLRRALLLTASRPRAIVTLMGQTAARTVVARFGIPIEVVVGRRPDLAVKPAPDQLQEAARLLGVDVAATVMIGDSTWDERAAAAAGAAFVGLAAPGEFPADVAVARTLDEAVECALAGPAPAA